MPCILVVDDDDRLRSLLTRYLGDAGYTTFGARHGAEALELLSYICVDAIVLDVMMPVLDGKTFLQTFRQNDLTPVVMLTALSDVEDRISGLELGADDYLGKPFDPKELVLRLQAILRRGQGKQDQFHGALLREEVTLGSFVYLRDQGRLDFEHMRIDLTEKENRALALLVDARGGVVERDVLSDARADMNTRAGDVLIKRLRQKIEIDVPQPITIQTVRGKGYRLVI